MAFSKSVNHPQTRVVVQGDPRAGREDEDTDVEVLLLDDAEVVDLPCRAGGRLDVAMHGRGHPQVVELDLCAGGVVCKGGAWFAAKRKGWGVPCLSGGAHSAAQRSATHLVQDLHDGLHLRDAHEERPPGALRLAGGGHHLADGGDEGEDLRGW